MRAADLDDAGELLFLGAQGLDELGKRGLQLVHEDAGGGDVHRRREGVVGALAFVDVVVGVDGLLRAEDALRQFDGAVADDLVGVHVALRARARLPDDEREVRVEIARDDLVGGRDDELGLVLGQQAELGIGQRASLL